MHAVLYKNVYIQMYMMLCPLFRFLHKTLINVKYGKWTPSGFVLTIKHVNLHQKLMIKNASVQCAFCIQYYC